MCTIDKNILDNISSFRTYGIEELNKQLTHACCCRRTAKWSASKRSTERILRHKKNTAFLNRFVDMFEGKD